MAERPPDWRDRWRDEDMYAQAAGLIELYGEPDYALMERNPDGTYTVRQVPPAFHGDEQ
jgi:hypothetical protein